jgi:hypothetical protein
MKWQTALWVMLLLAITVLIGICTLPDHLDQHPIRLMLVVGYAMICLIITLRLRGIIFQRKNNSQ